jgi:hypothetical protein
MNRRSTVVAALAALAALGAAGAVLLTRARRSGGSPRHLGARPSRRAARPGGGQEDADLSSRPLPSSVSAYTPVPHLDAEQAAHHPTSP